MLLNEISTFPKTHDLSRLIDAVRSSQSIFPQFTLESAVLNEYAVDVRYEPEVLVDADEDEAKAAIGYAKIILDHARQFLEEKGLT